MQKVWVDRKSESHGPRQFLDFHQRLANHGRPGDHMNRRSFALAAIAATFLSATPLAALAQAYPAKPIRIVVPFPAGSSTDIVARTVGARLSERVKQPVVIDNKPGAGGNIAGRAVLDSPADGYTLFMGTVAQAVGASFYQKTDKTGFDMVNDMLPVALTTTAPLVIVANPQLPIHNMADLLAYARRPGAKPMTYGSGGNGTANHLAGEIINQVAGTKLQHVPYKGAVLSFTDLMSGQLDLVIASMIDSMPLVQSGKIRAIAVTGPKRIAALPNVQAAAETLPGFEAVGWHGVMAPVGTPAEVVDLLNREIVAVLQLPDVRAKLEQGGATPAGGSPQEFGAFVRKEVAKWSAAVKAAKLKAD